MPVFSVSDECLTIIMLTHVLFHFMAEYSVVVRRGLEDTSLDFQNGKRNLTWVSHILGQCSNSKLLDKDKGISSFMGDSFVDVF